MGHSSIRSFYEEFSTMKVWQVYGSRCTSTITAKPQHGQFILELEFIAPPVSFPIG